MRIWDFLFTRYGSRRAELWRMLRPGGTLAITSWGARVFEPANRTFWDAIAPYVQNLYKQFTHGTGLVSQHHCKH
ncbi:MAG: hypothetical protein HC778_05605 [Chamaesiphon sp. CSU_1_12]|nr:hypothetical protein [Chamaesiphon sp. CSU_1_12]